MAFAWTYATPDGFDDLSLESDGEVLTGLWFEGSRDDHGSPTCCPRRSQRNDLPVFRETCQWLDLYFNGVDPDFTPPYRLVGATPFREAVSLEMRKIPFGATVTYGDMSTTLAKTLGRARMSAQAVGQAVGWNPICLIIPCHRVVGARGALTGYGGGLRNKAALLDHEARFHDGQQRLGVARPPEIPYHTRVRHGHPGIVLSLPFHHALLTSHL